MEKELMKKEKNYTPPPSKAWRRRGNKVSPSSLLILLVLLLSTMFPNTAKAQPSGPSYLVSGAGSSEVNGVYIENGEYNGYPQYTMGDYAIRYEYTWQIIDINAPWEAYYENFSGGSGTDTPPNTGWNTYYGSYPSPTVEIAAQKLNYSTKTFSESEANDGSLAGSITITHNNYEDATFSGNNGDDFVADGKVSISNLPAGLTASVIRQDELTLILQINGTSNSHNNADDVSNLTVSFADGAFSGDNAADVTNATIDDIAINFIQEYYVASSGGDFTTIAAALAAVNDGDVIVLAGETFTENNLQINNSVTFRGQSPGTTIVQGASSPATGNNRVFVVSNNSDLVFSNLTIQNGTYTGQGAAISGSIYGNVNITIENCVVTQNSGSGQGGIITGATVSIRNTAITNNQGSNARMALISAGDELTLENVTITGNTISSSNIAQNAGLLYGRPTTIRNSTITGNSVGLAFNYGTVSLSNTILAGNDNFDFNLIYGITALYDNGGNIVGVQQANYSRREGDLFSNETTILYSHMADGSTASSWNRNNQVLENQNLNVASTPDLNGNTNGTPTLALQEGSFAINAGVDEYATTTDQRGYYRNGTVDIGAYEYDGIPLNAAPTFNAGSSTDLSLALNASATSINDSLAVTDTDTGNNLSWTVTTAPTHGTLAGFPASATSTGSSVTPSGLSYTPSTDYTGTDQFVIQITDGTATASITVNVSIKESQSITFGTIAGKTYGDASFSLGDTETDKGLTVTYTAADPSIVSISDNTATILKAGSTTITASQSGNDNYTAATSVQQTLTVSAKVLTVTGATVADKEYDASTSASISGASLSGLINDDVVTLSNATSGTFAQDTVGTDIEVTTAMSLSGTDAGNYSLTQPELSGDITTKELTVTGAQAAGKTYDGNSLASISGASLNGVIGSEDVSLGNTTSGTFAQSSVGTNIEVTTAMTLTGDDADNYHLTQPELTATISPLAITVTANSSQSKVYGDTDPTFTYSVSPALVSGDSFSGALTRATGEDVDSYAIAQGTLSAGVNYDLTFVADNFAITQKEITVTADADQSKVYGENDPTLTYAVSPALVSGDSFSGALSREAGEDADSYAIAQGTLSAGSNYDVTFVADNFEIEQKAITVTANSSQSKEYGETDPTFTYSVSPALVSGDSFSGALTRETGEDAESYAIAQGTLSAGSNYDLTFVADNFTINAKAITVTANSSQSKEYGETDPTFTYSVSPALVSGDSFSGALTRETGEDAESYAIAQGTLSAGSNYDLTFVADNFTINAKPITVTANSNQSKVYGETDPTFTYSVSPALVSGDSFSGALTRTSGEDVDSYTIAQGSLSAGSNYDLTFVADTFEITQKEITVTADADQSKVYGDTDPTLTYSVSPALVSGDSFSGALTREAGEDADSYAIAQGTLSAGSNYDVTFVADNFAITQKEITVTADADQSKVYGDTDPTFTYAVSPALVSGDSFSGALSREAGEDVDSYAITQGTLSAGSNYDLTFVADNFEITQKEITVIADADQSKVYGDTDPTLTYSVSPALVSGDSFSGALTREAGEDVDSYAIAQGTLSAGSNYDLTFVADNFEITQKEITVTADADQSKVYGDTDPTFTYSVSPALVSGDSFSGALSREAGEDVDSYAIAQGTLSAGSNYDVTFVADNFEITQKAVTVTADADQSKVYGDTDPTLTYSVSPALVSGDSFSGALSREAGEEVDSYAIGQGSLSLNANYTLIFEGADFAITPKEVTVTADADQSKIYGEPDPTFSYSVSPALEAGDSFSGALAREAGEDAASYAITQGTLTAGDNYELSFVSASFVIERAAQTITFNAIPEKNLEQDGDFELGATASSGLPVSYELSYDAQNSPVEVDAEGYVTMLSSGTVTFTAVQAGNNNYLPAASVSQDLIIRSSDATIHQLVINGETYDQPEEEIYYQIDCDNIEEIIVINFATEANASASEARQVVIDTPLPGIYRQDLTITSEDGSQQQNYHITVEHPFTFDELVEQKYNNVMLVNNNPDTNGGYRFTEFRWYRDGQLIGEGQVYSAGQNASNRLDDNATYSLEVTTSEGDVIQTCDFNIDLNAEYTLTVTPNPARAGSSVEVITNYDQDMLSDRTILVTNLYGAPVLREQSAANNTTIALPGSMSPGTYVVTTVAGGVSLNTKIVVQ